MDDYDYEDYEDDYGSDNDEINDYYPDEEALDNGHNDLDEEDIGEQKAEELLYGEGEEKAEEADAGVDEEEDVEVEEEEVIEEKKPISRIVPPEKRKTHPIMTKFEYSYLISQRAIAIEHDSPLMNPDTKFVHSIDIAKEETELGINPIIIQRVMPDDSIEEWKCSELKLSKFFIDNNEIRFSN